MNYKPLLGIQNAKTIKGEDLGYLTGILYLAPSTEVDGMNLCKFASKGCKKACLFTSGRGKFSNVKNARINKTEFFRDNLNDFFYSLEKDINKLVKRAAKLNLIPTVRLNGTSDIRWENYRNKNNKNIFEIFPTVQFYDYTKDFKRDKALSGAWSNYHLTFSVTESKANQREALKLLDKGVNIAMVFRSMPEKFLGKEVIDGDMHDLRFLDKKGVIVGLKAKGDAKKDVSGFVFN